MKLENDLRSDPIRPLFLRIAIPSMLAQFVSVLYSVVDRMYIGLDEVAVADGVEAAIGLLDQGAGAGQRGQQLLALRLPGSVLSAAGGKQGVGHGRLLSRGRAGAEGAREPLYPEGMNSLDKYSKL